MINEIIHFIGHSFGFLKRKTAKKCSQTTSYSLETFDGTICHCKYPHLVTQTSPESDCNVPVGCKPNGNLSPDFMLTDPMKFGQCICNDGYKSDFNEFIGPTCRPNVASEIVEINSNGHILNSNKLMMMNSENRSSLIHDSGNRSFFDPCQINQDSGNYLHLFRKSDGTEKQICACNPKNGFFPINPSFSMLSSDPAATACMNIFLAQPKKVKYTEKCHFKVKSNENLPECYITFHNIPNNDHIFQSENSENKNVDLKVKITWPFTWANITLKNEAFIYYNLFAPISMNTYSYEKRHTANIRENLPVTNLEPCLTYESATFNSKSQEISSGIPNCSGEIRMKLINKAKLNELKTPFGAPPYFIQNSVEWTNWVYYPYCLKNDELHINREMLSDVSVNMRFNTTTVFTDQGLQLPEYDDRKGVFPLKGMIEKVTGPIIAKIHYKHSYFNCDGNSNRPDQIVNME